jgi:hypothetical protein
MAIWRLIRDTDDGQSQIDGMVVAVVEAATESAARTAALALDSRFPSNYWTTATAEDLEAAPYLGGLFTLVQDNGF